MSANCQIFWTCRSILIQSDLPFQKHAQCELLLMFRAWHQTCDQTAILLWFTMWRMHHFLYPSPMFRVLQPSPVQGLRVRPPAVSKIIVGALHNKGQRFFPTLRDNCDTGMADIAMKPLPSCFLVNMQHIDILLIAFVRFLSLHNPRETARSRPPRSVSGGRPAASDFGSLLLLALP